MNLAPSQPACLNRPCVLPSRVWNSRFDAMPAAVFYAYATADVAAAVKCARDWGVRASPATGRHNLQGAAVQDGFLIIDLTNMTRVIFCARFACPKGMHMHAHMCIHSLDPTPPASSPSAGPPRGAAAPRVWMSMQPPRCLLSSIVSLIRPPPPSSCTSVAYLQCALSCMRMHICISVHFIHPLTVTLSCRSLSAPRNAP
jgi:hypothetical protein